MIDFWGNICLFRHSSVLIWISSLGWSVNAQINLHASYLWMNINVSKWNGEFQSFSEPWDVLFLDNGCPQVLQMCCNTWLMQWIHPENPSCLKKRINPVDPGSNFSRISGPDFHFQKNRSALVQVLRPHF